MAENQVYTLLKQLRDKDKVVGWISEITGESEESVLGRLRQEYADCGVNVQRAFFEAGLVPFEWSDGLIRFYEETDAFLYELVLWNMNSHKRRLRRWIRKYLEKWCHAGAKVLCIGDGLGFDSAYFGQLGYKVTYFEHCGYSQKFAEKVFAETDGDINVVTDEGRLEQGMYDAVVCLDVLEHVPEPVEFVGKLGRYLRQGGRLIVHAPFYMVHRSKPTHLKANRKYSGSISLYRKNGFRLIDGKPQWNPLVLEKTGRGSGKGFDFHVLWLRLTGMVLVLGRFSVWPFLWVNGYHKKKREWFGKAILILSFKF